MTTQSIGVSPVRRTGRFLTQVLILDAAASGALGVLLLAFGWALDGRLGVPVPLATTAGGSLVVWAAAVAAVARRGATGAVRAVVAVNVAWVLASLALIATGAAELTGLGTAFVAAQAAAVALFAELQITGLRKTGGE